MKSLLLKNVDVVTPETVLENTCLRIEDNKIADISPSLSTADETVDLGGVVLWPGFIDIHIHGAVGVDTNAANTEDLGKVAAFLASQGVTAWLPTLVPDSGENYQKAIGAIDGLMESQAGRGLAQAVGVHYEGVFASEKMCGALHPEFFKRFTGSEIGQLPRLKDGVHFTTLAPEVEGGIDLIGELVRQNWVVSIGHTKADIDILEHAYEAGARHLTHFYNAMTGLHHRDVGVVGWAFSNENMTFDIIADGIHVHPDMLRFACLSKTPGKVSLISDAVLPTGMGDGDFEIWGERVSVENGRTRNERGSIAGSVITMLDAAKRMLALGFSAPDVSRMASLNPAKLLRLGETHGSIEVGKRADLVAINSKGGVVLTVIEGKIVR